MAHAPFVHLRIHSAYSMAEGAIKLDQLAKLAAKQDMPAVALTDTRNLFGALEFSKECAKAGVQPIIGCQISVRREDISTGHGQAGRAPDPDALVLLVQSERGYLNLIHLVSKAFLETESGETPQIAWADLEDSNEGLIALTAGPGGTLGRQLLEGQRDKAEATIERLLRLFPGRLYIELMRHGVPAEDRIEAALLEFADRYHVPLVATNEAFFADEGMFEAHDALICIADKSFVAVHNRRRLTREHRFKSAAEMVALFADIPEAVNNTLVIARRCAYMVEERKPILPRSPKAGEGRTEEQALRESAREGLERRLVAQVFTPEMDAGAREHAARPYRERLEFELNTIVRMGFAGYFMIVADFIQWAKDHGIPVGPGRGSGAGSLVAWSLLITDLDPLRFNLLFERFLNPERVSMPDFDIDFCQNRRDEVIRYVQHEYGRDRVAQIITFGKLQARAVLRSVGRVFEMPLGYVDKICKLIPNNPAAPVTLQEAIDADEELKRLRDTDESVTRLFDISLKLEGLYAHASTHAAGVVIGDRPLEQLVPLYRDPGSDMPVTQFNMKYVEQAGLVKFDFLGLKTLTVLQEAVKLIGQRGIAIDLNNLPLDDRKTFDLLSRADAAGVFQLESTGMRDVLRKLRPDVFEDIIAVVALYRPGPMDNIPSFINRKHGTEPIDYLHPSLEPVLKETYGIMVYQEQVMQAAQVLAGYSLGAADLLRRAMGKKIKAEMDAQRDKFVEGASARGIDRAKASEIFDTIDKFAGYGFNKSHAAAYALIAYQTAYLKANYPVEFMAASMALELSNTDKLAGFKGECGRLGIPILPPDINRSAVSFSVEDAKIRYALAAIRNVGAGAMAALVAERDKRGPFKSMSDFAGRLDANAINKRLLENLAKAGALDSLEPNRAKVFAGSETIMRHAQSKSSERSSKQVSLFGGEDNAVKLVLPGVPDWRPMEKLSNEFEAIGFYLSAHPLDAYSGTLDALKVRKAKDLPALTAQDATQPIRMAGTVVAKRERVGKRGNKFAFVMLSDDTGTFEVTMWSEVLSQSRDLLDSGAPVLLTVDVQMDDERGVRLLCTRADPLEKALAARLKNLRLAVTDMMPVHELQDLLAADGRGNGRITLAARANGSWVEIVLPGKYAIQPKTLSGLKNVPGIVEIREV